MNDMGADAEDRMSAWAWAAGGGWSNYAGGAWTNVANAPFVAILRLISVSRKRSFRQIYAALLAMKKLPVGRRPMPALPWLRFAEGSTPLKGRASGSESQ
ncbi:hypothetical protein K9B33_15215 [Sphingobium sp. 3R8]|uniref:hypothetical protein n=1 Tax=Sphingobium sp. 3R8 TaxID=2874921 RepID=UPI001CCAA23E|nr:hypothetical protein [Sphingobium sp. 3R8]MBZ9648896.1 hypothetical protein [Sphingobium sp. 3R8]